MIHHTTHGEDPFHIVAASPRADDQTRVLKDGETFAVLDRSGDIRPAGLGEEGLYHMGTRHLSDLRLRLCGRRPLLLGSTVSKDNALFAVDLTNPDIAEGEAAALPRECVHLLRSVLVRRDTLHVQLRLRSYATEPVDVTVGLAFAADFVDLFEVRGMQRERRGRMRPPIADDASVVFTYEGLDGVVRRTRLSFEPAPMRLAPGGATMRFAIPPGHEHEWVVRVQCETAEASVQAQPSSSAAQAGFEAALADLKEELRQKRSTEARVRTSNSHFDEWIARSTADLHMLITATPEGRYPYAGVPWYSTVFGRDGIITAFEYLWLDPTLARDVLVHLAATQADGVDAARDAQPGRILHESRHGEMANLGEVPFGRYYGSVDATPLFVVLAGAYFGHTGDLATMERLWPNIARALEWIDKWGDIDGDGFYEYCRQSEDGLVSQGWKDSADSVFHADGSLAEPPIALCETQAYVHGAWSAAARIARALGHEDVADRLRESARALQSRFEDAFWCEDLSTYALALDASKRPCRVRTSNAGHCLFAGIARADRARRVGAQFVEPHFFTGFGVRTVAVGEARYNPMSYHNGSVWPHDNALIGFGAARYGVREPALRILEGLFDASIRLDMHRMPELFCGFPRRHTDGPTAYPMACAPQAWAAGAPFLLLQACLGMSFDARECVLRFDRPQLPEFLDTVRMENLRVGDCRVVLEMTRHENDVGVNLVSREGECEVIVAK